MAASALPGFVNYVIVIYLTYALSASAAGEYRILFSIFSLAGLATLLETSKVFVRAVARDDSQAMGALFLGRIYFAISAVSLLVLAVVLAPAGFLPERWINASPIAIAVMVAALFYSLFDLYAPYLQAKQSFDRFFLFALIKYITALVLFIAMIWVGYSVTIATTVQLVMMTLFHAVFFLSTAARDMTWSRASAGPVTVAQTAEPREAAVLSFANAIPNALEHIDKLVIGAVFGLEVLGLYTLGFSTGRFIYNSLKPAIYIYYRQFVDTMPPARIVLTIGIGFTLFGLVCAGLYWWAIAQIPALYKFRGTEWVAAIIFASYGVAMADAIYAQAFAINKDTRSGHLLTANLISSAACIAMFIVAAMLPVSVALLVFAAHYCVRHALTMVILSHLRRRDVQEGRA
ncbi:MAG: hypothetical protein ACRCTD_16880 [Beijerinckiaceae bacterium]